MISDRDRGGLGYDLGMKAEDLFRRKMIEIGWEVYEADREENIYEHWDFAVWKDAYLRKIDVKAQKRVSRNDTTTSNEWVWVELLNNGGYPGWLYQTHANYLAFQYESMFHLVTPHELRVLIQEKVEPVRVNKSADAQYKLFTRHGRKDLLTLVRYDDLPVRHTIK